MLIHYMKTSRVFVYFNQNYIIERACLSQHNQDSVLHSQIDLHFLTLQEYSPRLVRGVCFVLNRFNVLIYALFSINWKFTRLLAALNLFISFNLEILAVLQKRERYYRQFAHDGD